MIAVFDCNRLLLNFIKYAKLGKNFIFIYRHRWLMSTRKMQVLASKLVSGTQVLTCYTFFYFQLLDYSRVLRTSITRSEHASYDDILLFYLFLINFRFFNGLLILTKLF